MVVKNASQILEGKCLNRVNITEEIKENVICLAARYYIFDRKITQKSELKI